MNKIEIKKFTHVATTCTLTWSKLAWGSKLQQKVNLGPENSCFF